MNKRKLLRIITKVALCILGILFLYALLGTLASLITVNGNPEPGNDVVVYLVNNGVHTDIVVPTRTEQFDWSRIAPPGDTRAKIEGSFLAIGWGSQDFYLNVPEWKDLTVFVAFKAISGTGGTALHITYVDEPSEDSDSCRLTLSLTQYNALVQYILASAQRGESESFIRINHEGYGRHDAFYEGKGHYSPFFTCNTWANSALKACGQKCCLWTALQQPIFWKYK